MTPTLEQRIADLEARNKKVELDKKWETSAVRRILLMVFTYVSVAFYFLAIGIENPFLSAVVPTVGFLLSTLTLPFFKRLWMRRQKNQEGAL